MSKLGEMMNALLKPSGPRREAAVELDRKLDQEKRDNQAAILRNMRAVRSLINDTIDLAEGR